MTGDRDTARTAAWVAARLQVVAHRAHETSEVGPVEDLRDVAARALGETAATVYLIECCLEEIRSRSRDAADSADAWRGLRGRAQAHLTADHPTLMRIRSFEARYQSRRHRPDDLDRAVRMCEEIYRAHLDLLGPSDHRTRVVRTNLAVALCDRAAAGDLATSGRILREEVLQRSQRYGEQHPFAWEARAHLARTLVRIAELADNPRECPDAAEAVAIADWLLGLDRQRFGRFHPATLRVHALRARALLVCDRAEEAAAEIRYVQAAARRSGDRSIITDSWPDIALTRLPVESVQGPPDEVSMRRTGARHLSAPAA